MCLHFHTISTIDSCGRTIVTQQKFKLSSFLISLPKNLEPFISQSLADTDRTQEEVWFQSLGNIHKE